MNNDNKRGGCLVTGLKWLAAIMFAPLVFPVALVLFFVWRDKEGKEQQFEATKRYLAVSGVVIVLAIIGGVFGDSEDSGSSNLAEVASSEQTETVEETSESETEETTETEEETTESTEEETAEEEPELTPEEAKTIEYEEIAEEVFGSQLEEVYYNDLDKNVRIAFKMSDGFTGNSIRRGADYSVVDFMSRVNKGEDMDYYAFFGKGELIDTYGNVDERNVYNVQVSSETVNQINYDNFNTENLKEVADIYDVHAAYLPD